MKVYQINVVCGSGSTGRIAADLAQTIQNQGGETRIAYGRGASPEGIDAIKISNKLDLYIHAILTRLTDKHGLYSKKSTKRLIQDIKAYDPDIIHLHNIHGYYLNYEMLFDFLKELKRPIVWTLHDCWPFTGHCAYFDFVHCEKWKIGCKKCPQYRSSYPYALFKDGSKTNYLRKKAAFTGLKNVTIVTPSKWLGRLVKESYLEKYDVRVIPNGIDLKRFVPKESKKRTKHLILGVANVWDRRKGLDYLKKLSQILDVDKYEIAVVGVSKKQIKDLPIGMIGIEHTNSVEELMQLYSEASVFVNPTLEDNFPTTNLEALACGTPVVTFATGGSVESIDETCGRIVPQKDVQALKVAVEELCKQVEMVRAACRERALSYNKYDRFGDYLTLYKECIDHYHN